RFLSPPQLILLSPALDPPHHLRMTRPFDRHLLGLVEDLRVQVVAALALWLLLLNWYPVFVRISVLADARHLPGDFNARSAGLDREAIAADLAPVRSI